MEPTPLNTAWARETKEEQEQAGIAEQREWKESQTMVLPRERINDFPPPSFPKNAMSFKCSLSPYVWMEIEKSLLATRRLALTDLMVIWHNGLDVSK